ncbi:MAG: vitamin K epoxide reductase family protein [Solirubrobacteraceae bacterium]
MATATSHPPAGSYPGSSSATDRRLRIAAVVVALIGLGIAGYLTYVHYAKLKPLCLSSGACETVQSSSYAKLAGIPVPVLGVLGYISILVSLALRGDVGRLASCGFALVGFLFSAYLTYRELFTINAICQWCLGSAICMTVLAVLTVTRLLREEVPEPAG